jgi:arginine decarboxylase
LQICESKISRDLDYLRQQCKQNIKSALHPRNQNGTLEWVNLCTLMEPNRLIAASIGLARPVDHSQYGYLSEHHSTGETAQKAGDYAEDVAMEMLATTIGLPDDPSLTWDQKEEQWKLSGKIYKTHKFIQSDEGNKGGLWTTVISAGVMIL